MWLNANSKELQWFLESASVYWEKNLPRPADDSVILVEAFHQDIRVNLRNQAFANAHPRQPDRKRNAPCQIRRADRFAGRRTSLGGASVQPES